MTGLPMSWTTQLDILLIQLLCQGNSQTTSAQQTCPEKKKKKRSPDIALYSFCASPPGTPAPLVLECLQRECRSQGLLQLFCRSQQERAAKPPLKKQRHHRWKYCKPNVNHNPKMPPLIIVNQQLLYIEVFFFSSF